MAVYDRKLYPIDIVDLSEDLLDPLSRAFSRWWEGGVDVLLGLACIKEAFRQRCLSAGADMACRIAMLKADRRMVGFCLSVPQPKMNQSSALVTHALALRHLKWRIWTSPRLWRYVNRFLVRRIKARFFGRGGKEQMSAFAAQDGLLDGKTEYVAQLIVDADYRFGNIGFDLMLDMEEQARRRSARRVCGLVNRNNIRAQRVYAAVGWKRTSPGDTNHDHFMMHKDLEVLPE
ncbi:MAG: GNAT family N-acetyltransferase [Planctomycetes bacterium]|nr:GNAT family N-acetyltransferase [Planctomycetota bacterium]